MDVLAVEISAVQLPCEVAHCELARLNHTEVFDYGWGKRGLA